MAKKIEINVDNVELKQFSELVSYKYNVNSVLCKNIKPTSAVAKCVITSNLNNVREIKDIFFPYSIFDFRNYITKVNFKLDTDYTFSAKDISPEALRGGVDKTISLKTSATWSLEDNIIEDFNLSSDRLQNNNNMEAIIPASSCFNLTMREKVSTVTISYTSITKLRIYDEADQMIVGSSLSSMVTSIINITAVNNITASNSFFTIPIIGEIKVNIIETDYSELAPCV